MLNSVPFFLQAAMWPLIGAAIILAFGRLLPTWLRRAIAAASALASLLALRAPGAGGLSVSSIDLAWDPINFFRMGLAFQPHSLSLLIGTVLAGSTAAMTLALDGRDADGQRTPWHALMLIALAGCLAMMLAANLLALTLGSGLLAVAVLALTTWAGPSAGQRGWPPLSIALPGVAATLLLFGAALGMDVEAGHASLQAKVIPESALMLMGGAGLLWTLTFIMKGADRPESAAALLLPCAAGLYLLARVQIVAPLGAAWLPAAGLGLLLAGSLLGVMNGIWPGLAVQQIGLAVAYIWLVNGGQQPAALPWPAVTSILTLGLLAVWSSGSGGPAAAAPWQLPEWLRQRVEPWWARARSALAAYWQPPRLDRWRRWQASWLGQRQAAILPGIALASVVGLPFTAGAVGRWAFYGEALYQGRAAVLLITLAADILASAAVLLAIPGVLDQACRHKLRPSRAVAMVGLAAPLVLWGIAPRILGRAAGLEASQPARVSPWGIGLLYILPWLVGAWLAYTAHRSAGRLERLRNATRATWPYRASAWVFGRLAAGLYWVSQVGEGEGWWGWALIVLALGALFWASR